MNPDTTNAALAARYDAIAYAASPHPLTHPDRLATIATFLGVKAPPVATCRVLEVGCNDGANLIPMAAERLAPNGVMFVSFNALPGCRVRQAAWEILHFHVDRIADPHQRLDAARKLARLPFLHEKRAAARSFSC